MMMETAKHNPVYSKKIYITVVTIVYSCQSITLLDS